MRAELRRAAGARVWHALALALACALCGPVQAEDTADLRVLPLFAHVAEAEGAPVASEDFMRQRIELANRIFAPYRVGFALAGCKRIGPTQARLESRADRDALARYRERQVIDWFVVQSLRDVDVPAEWRRGVHWHARGGAGAHYVITSLLGAPGVFAHELGHYLGNPSHSDVAGNLLSYTPGAGLPFLDALQRERLERALRGYLARGELRRTTLQHPQALTEMLAHCLRSDAGSAAPVQR